MARQYLEAGAMVDAYIAGKSFSSNYAKFVGKTDYLLAVETIKYNQVIETLLNKSCISYIK